MEATKSVDTILTAEDLQFAAQISREQYLNGQVLSAAETIAHFRAL